MRVGIITLPLYRNYGGVLQNFALQTTLRKLGHEPVTIDRVYPRGDRLRFLFSYMKHLFYSMICDTSETYFSYQYSYRPFYLKKFLRKYIDRSKPVINYNYKTIIDNRCEAVVVGSDQIWRKKYFDDEWIKAYYLDFIKNTAIRKVAYAPSLGVSTWEYGNNITKECKELIKEFRGVSTREDSGIVLFRDNYDINITSVLDPTLMLEAHEYMELCKDIKASKSKYLFAYILDKTPDKLQYIKLVADAMGLPAVVIYLKKDICVPIEKWLAYIRDCEFVITDSFHGTAFSIIFHKPFWAILNGERGSDRFLSLLNKLNLENRLIINCKRFDKTTIIDNIDWVATDNLLNKWRMHSYDFLSKSLK